MTEEMKLCRDILYKGLDICWTLCRRKDEMYCNYEQCIDECRYMLDNHSKEELYGKKEQ